MERVKLCCLGEAAGEVLLTPEGSRTIIRAAMEDPEDGLYRAWLVGDRGELALGVMEPGGGKLTACRRVYRRDVESLGVLRRGEARCSFRFGGETPWRETGCPAAMFRTPFLRSRLGRFGRAWHRREGERLELALPLEAAGPFPLEALFCLGRLERVEGRECVVYAFQGEEPVGW